MAGEPGVPEPPALQDYIHHSPLYLAPPYICHPREGGEPEAAQAAESKSDD
jgi:hypothetical protein